MDPFDSVHPSLLRIFSNDNSTSDLSLATHFFGTKSYRLDETDWLELCRCFAAHNLHGSVRNLDESNRQLSRSPDGNYDDLKYSKHKRLIVDFDFPKSKSSQLEEKRRYEKFLKPIISKIVSAVLTEWSVGTEERNLIGMIVSCDGRFHVHFLNLCASNKFVLKCFLDRLKELSLRSKILTDPQHMDSTAGINRLSFYGSLKVWNSRSDRHKPYRLFAGFEIDRLNKITKFYDIPSYFLDEIAFPKLDIDNIYQLMSLQRPIDDAVDVVLDNPPSAAKKGKKRGDGVESKTVAASEPREKKKKQQKLDDRFFFFNQYMLSKAQDFAGPYDSWVRCCFLIITVFSTDYQLGYTRTLNFFNDFSAGFWEKYDENPEEVVKKFKECWDKFNPSRRDESLDDMQEDLNENETKLLRNLIYGENCFIKINQMTEIARFVNTLFRFVCVPNDYSTEENGNCMELLMYRKRDGVYAPVTETDKMEILKKASTSFIRILACAFKSPDLFDRLFQIFKPFLHDPKIVCYNGKEPDEYNNVFSYLKTIAEIRNIDSHILNFSAGYVFDLEKRRYADWSPDYVTRSQIYSDPKSVAPEDETRVRDLLFSWFGKDTDISDYVIHIVMYLLYPDNSLDRAIYVFFGPGGTGKSVLANILAAIFQMSPHFVVNLPKEQLTARNDSTLNASFKNCHGDERLCNISDLKMTQISETGWSWLRNVSGNDPTTFRGLYCKNNTTIRLQCKVFIQTNELPHVRHDENDKITRLRFIPMNRVFFAESDEDRTLLNQNETRRLGTVLMKIAIDEWINRKADRDYFMRYFANIPVFSKDILNRHMRSECYVCQYFERCTVESRPSASYDDNANVNSLDNYDTISGIYFCEKFWSCARFSTRAKSAISYQVVLKTLRYFYPEFVKISEDGETFDIVNRSFNFSGSNNFTFDLSNSKD